MADASSDAAAAAAAAAAAPAWLTTAGADAETLGYAQNRGWDKLEPAKAALAATQAHREASKLIGAPPESIVRIPTDANAPEWAGVYERVNKAAKTEKDYNFDGLKFKDGTELDNGFTDAVRQFAHRNHLSVEAGKDLAKTIIKLGDAEDDAGGVASQAQLAVEKKNLIDSWGPANVDTNLVIARNAANKLGIAPEAITALEGKIGYAAVMKMMHTIGTKIGEDSFVREANGGRPGALTKEQAAARITELQADVDWRARYLKGGAKENAEFQNLIKIKVGE